MYCISDTHWYMYIYVAMYIPLHRDLGIIICICIYVCDNATCMTLCICSTYVSLSLFCGESAFELLLLLALNEHSKQTFHC